MSSFLVIEIRGVPFGSLWFTASLNDDFEIENELKKLHTEPFSYMPRHYKNAKKQIFSWEKLAGNSKCLML